MEKLLEPLNAIGEALRQSHCARSGQRHACVGECTLTSAGIRLSCRVCGGGSEEYGPETRYFEMARHIVGALVPFEALAPEMQRRLAAAVKAELDGQKNTL